MWLIIKGRWSSGRRQTAKFHGGTYIPKVARETLLSPLCVYICKNLLRNPSLLRGSFEARATELGSQACQRPPRKGPRGPRDARGWIEGSREASRALQFKMYIRYVCVYVTFIYRIYIKETISTGSSIDMRAATASERSRYGSRRIQPIACAVERVCARVSQIQIVQNTITVFLL